MRRFHIAYFVCLSVDAAYYIVHESLVVFLGPEISSAGTSVLLANGWVEGYGSWV